MEQAGWPASFWRRVCPPAWGNSSSYCPWEAGRLLNGSPRSWGGGWMRWWSYWATAPRRLPRSLAAYPVRWVVNSDYQTGMLSSVQCGLRAVDTAADYLICLGDQPRLSGAVVEQVLQARKQVGAGIIIPTANGKEGPSRIDPQRLPGGNFGIAAGRGIKRGDSGPSRGYVRACLWQRPPS